jgi:hypothetical protein
MSRYRHCERFPTDLLTALEITYKSQYGRKPVRTLAQTRLITTRGTRIDTKSRLKN